MLKTGILKMNSKSTDSLRTQLDYEPVPLKFGTSGRRGLVADLTQLEVYINALAELEYLQSLSRADGGIVQGEDFFFACDLRPSSSEFVPEQRTRGELAQAIAQAIKSAGMNPVFLGRIPTPALASYAFGHGKGSMMVTGSHIPFDRNGYKTNTAKGELLKRDEAPILARVEQVRARLYGQPVSESLFAARGPLAGMFKDGHRQLPEANPAASESYLSRYDGLFGPGSLTGMRLVVYQHSAVGRDLLVELLRRCGAVVIPAGRSETFVPIDTEAIDDAQIAVIQSLAVNAWREHGPIDAVISTDGDSDRPLILGVEPIQRAGDGDPCRVRFFGGDLVGMVVAEYLGADAVVVPISCNDAVDRGVLRTVVEPKTRIGSPFVIAGMEKAVATGHKAVCGWEANGGFLLGTDITTRNGRPLKALPTRDAFLPILAVLSNVKEKHLSVPALFDRLPRRFSRAALLKNFPRSTSQRIVARFTPAEEGVGEVSFRAGRITLSDEGGREMALSAATASTVSAVRAELESLFKGALGFSRIARLNFTDGVRIYFDNGDVAHVRPSGNADELRIYAVADTQDRANEITRLGVAEPDGIVRQIERRVG
jgi:phosphomannomutase